MTLRKLRILLAEGSAGEAVAALRTLYQDSAEDLELTVVSTVSTLLATIRVVDPEVILLDLSLSLRAPMDAVHLVHRTAPGVPLVVFTEPIKKDAALRSLKEGAMDYLLKGSMDPETLERVLRTALERNTMRALTDLLRDPLTGLYTRDGFLTVGSSRLGEAQHTGGGLVLICAALENLLMLTEKFGPHAGDQAICDVTTVLKGSCRRSDIVARLAEAQFAILGIDAAAPSAGVMRSRLEQHLTVYNRARSTRAALELRTSIGSWRAQDSCSFPDFLERVASSLRLIPIGAEQSIARPSNPADHA